MSTQYTFDNNDNYFDSVLSSSSNHKTYSMKSTGQTRSRMEYISVTTFDGRTGVVYFEKTQDSFEIQGKNYPFPEIRTIEELPGVFYSRSWDINGKQWRTTFDQKTRTWKVFVIRSEKQDDEPVVVFNEHKSKALNKGDPPTITVSPSVSDDDFLTVLLILLWASFNQSKVKAGDISTGCAGAIVCCFGMYGGVPT